MDAINILWQVGILSAVLIFGIKLGLATGLANMSKRYLANTDGNLIVFHTTDH